MSRRSSISSRRLGTWSPTAGPGANPLWRRAGGGGAGGPCRRRARALTRWGAEAGAGAGAALAGPLLVDDELVDRVVRDKDGGLALLHADAQAVGLGLDVLPGAVLNGKGVAA